MTNSNLAFGTSWNFFPQYFQLVVGWVCGCGTCRSTGLTIHSERTRVCKPNRERKKSCVTLDGYPVSCSRFLSSQSLFPALEFHRYPHICSIYPTPATPMLEWSTISVFPGTVPVLAQKALYPGKLFTPRQIGAHSHPNLSIFSLKLMWCEFWELSTRKTLIKADTLSHMQLVNVYCTRNLGYTSYLLLCSAI